MVPLGAITYVVGAAVAVGLLVGSYYKGRESRESEIVSLSSTIESAKRSAKEAQDRAEAAAAQVRVEYRTKTETIIQESEGAKEIVEVIKRDHAQSHPDCVLPASLRLLWNRASSNGDKAKPASGVDDSPVTVAELAEGIRIAQDAFERNAAQQVALQNYIAQIQEAPAPK